VPMCFYDSRLLGSPRKKGHSMRISTRHFGRVVAIAVLAVGVRRA